MPQNKAKAQLREIQRFDEREMVGCTAVLARRYLAIHPKNCVVWIYYAQSLYEMARYSESLAALRRAARLCPPKMLHLVYSRFGNLHRKRGAFRLAERWYRRAIERAPSDATYQIFLGALLARAGRLQEAEAIHRRASRCKEGCIDEAFLNLGLVLRALERHTEARASFRSALAIDPKYKRAQDALDDVEQVIKLHRLS